VRYKGLVFCGRDSRVERIEDKERTEKASLIVDIAHCGGEGE
jgi:hypothetical protein